MTSSNRHTGSKNYSFVLCAVFVCIATGLHGQVNDSLKSNVAAIERSHFVEIGTGIGTLVRCIKLSGTSEFYPKVVFTGGFDVLSDAFPEGSNFPETIYSPHAGLGWILKSPGMFHVFSFSFQYVNSTYYAFDDATLFDFVKKRTESVGVLVQGSLGFSGSKAGVSLKPFVSLNGARNYGGISINLVVGKL